MTSWKNAFYDASLPKTTLTDEGLSYLVAVGDELVKEVLMVQGNLSQEEAAVLIRPTRLGAHPLVAQALGKRNQPPSPSPSPRVSTDHIPVLCALFIDLGERFRDVENISELYCVYILNSKLFRFFPNTSSPAPTDAAKSHVDSLLLSLGTSSDDVLDDDPSAEASSGTVAKKDKKDKKEGKEKKKEKDTEGSGDEGVGMSSWKPVGTDEKLGCLRSYLETQAMFGRVFGQKTEDFEWMFTESSGAGFQMGDGRAMFALTLIGKLPRICYFPSTLTDLTLNSLLCSLFSLFDPNGSPSVTLSPWYSFPSTEDHHRGLDPHWIDISSQSH